MKPGALEQAEMVISLCERFHCLPSALEREDASLLMMLAILREASPANGGVPSAM